MRIALRGVMIEILTSDPAILLFSGVGLVATSVSILRDAAAQRRAVPQLSVVVDEVAAETAKVAA